MAAGLAACGGGASSSTQSTAPTEQQTTATMTTGKAAGNGRPPAAASSSKGSDDSSSPDEGSASFRTPGGDDSIQNFGGEADSSKVEAETATLGAHLRARAKDDWAKSWTYPAKAAVQPLERLASSSSQLKGRACPAPSASLRIEGERAFASYHGPHGTAYFVALDREGDTWKVAALAPSEFP